MFEIIATCDRCGKSVTFEPKRMKSREKIWGDGDTYRTNEKGILPEAMLRENEATKGWRIIRRFDEDVLLCDACYDELLNEVEPFRKDAEAANRSWDIVLNRFFAPLLRNHEVELYGDGYTYSYHEIRDA